MDGSSACPPWPLAAGSNSLIANTADVREHPGMWTPCSAWPPPGPAGDEQALASSGFPALALAPADPEIRLQMGRALLNAGQIGSSTPY